MNNLITLDYLYFWQDYQNTSGGSGYQYMPVFGYYPDGSPIYGNFQSGNPAAAVGWGYSGFYPNNGWNYGDSYVSYIKLMSCQFLLVLSVYNIILLFEISG